MTESTILTQYGLAPTNSDIANLEKRGYKSSDVDYLLANRDKLIDEMAVRYSWQLNEILESAADALLREANKL